MGLDPTMLIGLMGNMGNMGQSAANTALSAVPMALSMRDRMRLRRDPILNLLNMRDLGQGYRAITQNPYGDPWSGWGGSFGQDQQGQNVGFGEAQVRAIMDMMGRTPGASTVANYQTLAGQQRPGVTDTTSDMRSLLGLAPSSLGGDISPMFVPKAAGKGNGGGNRSGGGGKPNKPGGGGGSTTPKPPAVAAGSGGGGLPSFGGGGMSMPDVNVNVGGMGGGGILGRILGNAFAARGGMPAFREAQRGPGNFLNNTVDFAMGREGGQRTGASQPNISVPPQHDWWNKGSRPNIPSYEIGTTFVPKTGVAKLHRGEAVIPAAQNPFAKSGGAQNQMLQSNKLPGAGNGKLPGAMGGGVSNGMQGGAPAPVQPQQPSVMQNLINNPMSLTPQIQQQIINRGTDSLVNNYGAMARGGWDRSAALGGAGANPNMTALNFGLAGGVSDLNRDVGIEAARTNFNDQMNVAGMQWGATRDAAQQGLAQQQFNQGVYNSDRDFMARMIESMNNTQQGDMSNQLSLWDRINNLGTGGINFPNTFLDRLRYGRQNQLVPGSVQMPTGGGGAQAPFDMSSWQQLTSWGG